MSRCSRPGTRPGPGSARRRGCSPSRPWPSPPPARPMPGPRSSPTRRNEAGATRAVRSAGRDRWADQPVRSARPIPEDEEDEEDDRDPVAENIIRWVPPVTALICAGIALYGFVYYQFFL